MFQATINSGLTWFNQQCIIMHIRCLFNQYDDICMRVSVPDSTFNEVGTTENQPGYPIFQQTQMQIEITINHWDLTWKTWKTWFEPKKWWLRHYIVIEFSYGKRRCPKTKKNLIFPPKKNINCSSCFFFRLSSWALSSVVLSSKALGFSAEALWPVMKVMEPIQSLVPAERTQLFVVRIFFCFYHVECRP